MTGIFVRILPMRTLILDVTAKPLLAPSLQALELHAYPQLLLDEMMLWKRESVLNTQQLLQLSAECQPAIVAFVGPQAIAAAWVEQAQQLLPKLFVFAHPPAETEAIIAGVNERVWILRRRRLAEREHQQPEALKPTDARQLFGGLPGRLRTEARGRAEQLIQRYHLSPLLEQVELETFERGLYCLSLLSEALPGLPEDPVALDIGCHQWSYAPFLKAYLAQFGRAALTGIELDPWFLQADGLTRGDWAQHWAAVAEADYLEGDVREQILPPQDLITLFLPIILPENALRWGIPARYHDPADLFDWVKGQLSAAGQVLIYSGVEQEHQAVLAVLQHMNWKPAGYAGAYKCPLRQREQGFVIRLRAQ